MIRTGITPQNRPGLVLAERHIAEAKAAAGVAADAIAAARELQGRP